MKLKNSQKKVSEQLVAQNWFLELVEDCKFKLTEARDLARQVVIEKYHEVGVDIIKNSQKHSVPISELVEYVAGQVEKGERTIRYCVQLVSRHPKLDEHAWGDMEAAIINDYGSGTHKKANWRWIINRYLPEAYKDRDRRIANHLCHFIEICSICGKRK